MPSSKNYKRNYKQEADAESPERKHERNMRVQARRAFEAALGHKIPDGLDVDHKQPLSKGGSNDKANLHLQRSGPNRSYPRNPDGSMKPKHD